MRIFKQKANQQTRSLELLSQAHETLSDDTLMNAVTQGAVWALETLYERYNKMLYSLAYRMVADHHIAEDLLQETFVAIWKNSVSYSTQSGTVRTWLFSIIHHRTIDYLRHMQRRAAINKVPLEAIEQDAEVAVADAWEETWRNIQGIHVRTALMRLPKEQRMVIELSYFQAWTHAEIAEGCQIPLGTVKARMRLGLQHLRRILADMGVDGL